MIRTMLAIGCLLAADAALASDAPEPHLVALSAEVHARATIDFERGRRRVRTGTRLAAGGAALGVVGGGVAVTGFVAALGGSEEFGMPMMLGGAAGVIAGGAMVVGSPFVVASGLSLERRSLDALGAEPERWAGRAAAGSAIGGVALGFVVPPAALIGVAAGVGFTVAQQAEYDRAFAEVRVAPLPIRDGGGIGVSGRF